jgi:VWFA-related protein
MTRCALLFVIAIGLTGFDQQPRFRAVADAVLVPVAVTERNRPVVGLTSADFELLDNGVPQALSSTGLESLAIDVSLVVDTSGSVDGPALTKFKGALQDIAQSLRPNDRVRLFTFGTSVLDITGFQPGGAPLPLDQLQVGGGTSFYHALAAALMTTRSGERPQLIVAFSDGLDNLSLLDAPTVSNLAGHSNASLFLLLARRPTQVLLRGVAPWTGQPNTGLLRDAADRTGGELIEPHITAPLPFLFDRVIDEFRTRYLLRYIPSGVAPEGWHDIVVRVKGGKYAVRARKGYQGG